MMILKGITLLSQTGFFNDDIQEWRRQSSYLKTWRKYKLFFHQLHREQKIAATTAGKGGYTTAVKNIYGAPPPPQEKHHEVIEDIQTTVQGIQAQSYDLEGLE